MEALGIDLKLIIAQIVNFSILLFVLNKLLYKPIYNMLDERQTKIEKGLKDSDIATKSREEAEKTAEETKQKAFNEAKEIIKEAKENAVSESSAIVKKANDQAERVLSSAKEEAVLMKTNALKEARKDILSLVIVALNKIVKDEMDEATKERLSRAALKEM